MLFAVPSSGGVKTMIRITGIGDHDRPEWLIRINGIRSPLSVGYRVKTMWHALIFLMPRVFRLPSAEAVAPHFHTPPAAGEKSLSPQDRCEAIPGYRPL
jgi:hypothetical protein